MYHLFKGLHAILHQAEAMNWPDWLQPHVDAFVSWVNDLLAYWDLDYIEYLLWLFLPIIIAFLLPIFLLFFIYGCVIFLHIYGLRHRIREAYASSLWDGARTSIASFWDGIGYLWHGYEAHGLENVPDTGPALFVAYHGTLPLDIYYLIAKVMLYKKRTLHVVGDKFVFKIPGWGKICKVFCITPGTVEDCVATLKEGNLLIIAPGGVREALFSNPVNYQIMWGKRLGFAKVILGADVPVIPVFTENCRDAFRTPRWGRRLTRRFYERTRLPLCPIYGGFPVKMITHLGKQLTFPQDSIPEDVKVVVKEKVHDLIVEHQRLPGSIFFEILQRFRGKGDKAENGAEVTSVAFATPDSPTGENEDALSFGNYPPSSEATARLTDEPMGQGATSSTLNPDAAHDPVEDDDADEPSDEEDDECTALNRPKSTRSLERTGSSGSKSKDSPSNKRVTRSERRSPSKGFWSKSSDKTRSLD
ncbi:PlsC domain-containing protein [Aphelenchoides fujianensis]|nr:PlsC domain-containing protein [Aphelenchoides fujianensis]